MLKRLFKRPAAASGKTGTKQQEEHAKEKMATKMPATSDTATV